MKRLGSLLAGVMLAALLPVGSASAAAAVQFLNPAPLMTGQVPELSSKEGRPVHLVAWTREAPAGALAEFELRAISTTPPSFNAATIDGTFVTSDAVEALFTIPDTWADGTYNLRISIFTGDGQTLLAEEEQPVIINNDDVVPPPPAENVEIIQPENGGQVGFFTPKDKRPNTIVTATASAGTEQVRVLYTTSSPGTEPVWQSCGSQPVGENGFTIIRCTLAEGESPAAVTAIAAAANKTPWPAPPDPQADEGTDAHRTLVYQAQPANVDITPDVLSQDLGKCQLFFATVYDQLGRPLAAANVDVHATGPDDQLTFATDDTSPLTARTSAYQAPNDGHVSEKRVIRCSDKTLLETRQGVHRAIGSPDRMHIESTSGTDNNGSFFFALFSQSPGGTQISAWADMNDDDSQNVSEIAGGARLGWGTAPPAPTTELFIDPDGPTASPGDCQSMTLIAREGGNPLIGGNVDIHISGPDSSVQFCSPSGFSQSRRDPDVGGHVAGTHEDGTRHAEGETDSTGRFVFGVSSLSDGVTEVLGWLDQTDDDTLGTAEPRAPAQVSWQPEGERDISLEANRKRVREGRRVRLSGSIEAASSACEAGQQVRLRAKRPNGRFKTIAKKNTNSDGTYLFRPRVRVTKIYKAIAPKGEICRLARSGNVRVRARG